VAESSYPAPDPVGIIAKWTTWIGGISAVLGFIGPMFVGHSNLGPPIGLFLLAPTGAIIGTLVGALRVARDSPVASAIAIGIAWATTLFYTYFGFFLFGFFVEVISLPLQLLILASSVFLLSMRSARSRLPEGAGRWGLIAIAGMTIILLTTLFPPVLLTTAAGPSETSIPAQSLVLFLEARFFSRGPGFIYVNPPLLAVEWMVTAGAAVGLCLTMWVLRRRRRAD
jgi:hypothetical protein